MRRAPGWLSLFVLVTAGAAHADAAPLAVVNAVIQQSEGGGAVPGGFTHVPGEILFFSFQVEGYKVSPEQKIRLDYRIEAADAAGVPIIEPVSGKVEEELAPEDKQWKPKVRREIPIPPLAGSGSYKITVKVEDELAKTSATREVSFAVRGHEVAPSDRLVIRNFHFYRGEEESEPLAQAVYRPGDSLWARFDITGYQFGEGNRIDVTYGLAVLAPEGKQLWSQANAAEEKTASFYPQRYVPGTMSLNLQPNIRPGEYTLVVTVEDRIGKQTYEGRETFRIEQ